MKRCIALTLLLITALSACAHRSETPAVPGTPPVTGAPAVTDSPISAPKVEPSQPQENDAPSAETESSEADHTVTSITLTINNSIYSVKLYDNETATALLARLPMTLNMSELNGNEKYHDLPDSLPTDSERVGSVNAGDLMLYGSDCLVLFYESFTSSYSYTKIGFIQDVSGLAERLGSGGVEVTLSAND